MICLMTKHLSNKWYWSGLRCWPVAIWHVLVSKRWILRYFPFSLEGVRTRWRLANPNRLTNRFTQHIRLSQLSFQVLTVWVVLSSFNATNPSLIFQILGTFSTAFLPSAYQAHWRRIVQAPDAVLLHAADLANPVWVFRHLINGLPDGTIRASYVPNAIDINTRFGSGTSTLAPVLISLPFAAMALVRSLYEVHLTLGSRDR